MNMETLAIINAIGLNAYATRPFAEGSSALDRVIDVARASADITIVLTCAETVRIAGLRTLVRDHWSMHDVLSEMARLSAELPSIDTVLYMHGDAPFTDAGLSATLLELHRRYRAEYTFADGYPPGFAAEIIATRSLPNLAELAAHNDGEPSRDGLFAVIQKDINTYDIETHLAPVDLRGYRFSPVCDTRRNFVAAQHLWSLGCRSAADVTTILPAHPELLRTLPAFMWVQITEGCPQCCSYCPYPAMVGDPRSLSGFMPVDRFAALMDSAEELCDDLVVDVSLWGEPSRHPDFRALAEAVLSHPRFTLLVETSGAGWQPGLAESVAVAGGERVQWIVSLDQVEPEGYRALRGEGQAEANAFAERMILAAPGRVHVQAVRMQDNESGLENFYRTWKKLTDKVIIQKYDSFAGCLPDRTVADLSPLERLPCRHLARDIAVLIDGSVPPCKHALVSTNGRPGYVPAVGNVFSDGLQAVWNGIDAWYEDHVAGRYPDPCGRCDEYHTFNA